MYGTIVAIVCFLLSTVNGFFRTEALHQPSPAGLNCFLCNTVDHDRGTCLELDSNHSHPYGHECDPNESFCTLVRVKYVLDGSRDAVIWSVERNCTSECQSGCITMGERTKLHLCRWCCQKNFCNFGTGGSRSGPESQINVVSLCAATFILNSKLFSV